MTGFGVDVSGLRQGGTQFGAAGDSLDGVLRTLDSALSAEGQCWGNDESGQAFAKEYVPNSKATLEAFGSLATALAEIRGAVDQTADAYEGSDHGNASGFTRTY
ncbi:hypothetical protein GCM10022243_05910 [Saccharothrix violaceirubra]|uniref:Uncharacterized protein YukE n=1 Tax=Saccharothrix violaceirubra TaxID=413306 RepID=A0A7W7WTA1_9PSEU|nr:WXG100 family type VII secretion target [Saccharothrix violaceirubra]MBB4963001.1 uncharacterized protein YukE [Saccharothrix violaceirubra]